MDKVRSDVSSGMEDAGRAATGKAKDAGEKSGRSFRQGFEGAVKGIGPGLRKAMIPATAALGLVAVGAKKAVDAASDLNEQVNKTGVVFKDAAPGLLDWSKNAATAMGQSRRQALEAAGTFGNMLVPMGIARKEAAGMSQRMVQLASDMASFNNASPEETLDALRAGLAGETEPLRRFGVFLNEARIRQEALNLGLIKGADTVRSSQAALATATTAAAAATRAHEEAARQLATAQDSVAAAQANAKASADALAVAQARAKVAAEQVSTAEDRQKRASDTLRNAKLALRNAQDNARSSQEALTEARREATEQLQELKDSAEDAALSEERASIGVERARQRLAEVTADAESTDLDKREAALSLAEAERDLEDAQDKRTDITSDLADAEAKGVEGADAVVAARRAAAQAEDEAERSSTRLTAAQDAYAKAQERVRTAVENLLGLQAALKDARGDDAAATARLTAAQERLEVAQDRNQQTAEASRRAQDRLTDAKAAAKDASKAMTRQLTAEEKAQATYAIILKDTKDAQGDFARTSEGLANRQRITKAQMEDTAAVLGQSLLPLMSELQGVLADIFGLMAKNRTATKVLIGLFAGFAAVIVVLNAALKTYEVIATVVKLVTKLWRNEQLKLNLAFLTNPIFLLVAAIALLVVGIIIAYKRVGWFRDAVNAMFRGIVDAAKWLLDFFKNNWQYIVAGIILGPFGLIAVGVIKHWDDIKTFVTEGIAAVLGVLTGAVDNVLKAGKAIGQAVKDGIVDGITGVANAVWGIVDNIGATLSSKAQAVIAWGRNVGTWLKDAAVNAVTGIANAVWGVISGIGSKLVEAVATIKGWGTDVGAWLKGAVVSGVSGLAGAVWGIISNIWAYITDPKRVEEIKGWGTSVGTWIKNGIVAGLAGLGKLIRDAIRRAIRSIGGRLGGAVGRVTGIFKGAAPQFAPGPQAVMPTGLGAAPLAGEGAGGLAGPAPPLYNLKQLMGAMAPETPEPPPVEVRVFIGDTELKGMVRAEVRQAGDATARVLLAATSGVA